MRSTLNETPYFLKAVFAFLSALWLWMFFPPMGKLGLVIGIHTFLPVLAVLFVAQLIPVVWVRVVLALVASEAYIVYYFRQGSGWRHGIVPVLHKELSEVLPLVHSGQLLEPFQTHLFLLAIIAIYWLLTYSSYRPKLWMFYNFLGIVVLAIIDGNTNVHPNLAVVVDVLIAFLVLGLSRFSQLRLSFEQFRLPAMRYLGPLLSVIVVSAGIAWLLPKAPAVWADPFNTAGGPGKGSGSGSGGVTQFIGYQENNSHLGGSFVMDSVPVLEVESTDPVYLRGKVYSDYTGKGWLAGSSSDEPVMNGSVPLVGASTFTAQTPTRKITQTIHVLSNRLAGDTVFGGYRITNIRSDNGNNPSLELNTTTGSVSGPLETQGNVYTVVSQAIKDPSGILNKLPSLPTSIAARKAMFTNLVGSGDLELPAELPSKVQQLAEQTVSDDNSEYQMVMAIEDYLQQYPYETTNIPVPGKNQDYVSQFLFQSEAGYCNNFSSAMAVMLRTVGIPTRWVTGFADGQPVSETSGGSGSPANTTGASNSTSSTHGTGSANSATVGSGAANTANSGAAQQATKTTQVSKQTPTTYLVSESDAHSWVEVYFPKYGWIPFDPTPGFAFPYLSNGKSSSGSLATPPPRTRPRNTTNNVPPAGSGTNGGGGQLPWQKIGLWVAKVLGGLAFLAVVAGFILYKRVLLGFYARLWRKETPGVLTRAMLRLFRLLQKKGLAPRRVYTIRDLAPSAEDSGLDQTDFQQLVVTVEKTWYGQETPEFEAISQAHRTWFQWIRAVILRRKTRDNKRNK